LNAIESPPLSGALFGRLARFPRKALFRVDQVMDKLKEPRVGCRFDRQSRNWQCAGHRISGK
jgi:hypothetical protein